MMDHIVNLLPSGQPNGTQSMRENVRQQSDGVFERINNAYQDRLPFIEKWQVLEGKLKSHPVDPNSPLGKEVHRLTNQVERALQGGASDTLASEIETALLLINIDASIEGLRGEKLRLGADFPKVPDMYSQAIEQGLSAHAQGRPLETWDSELAELLAVTKQLQVSKPGGSTILRVVVEQKASTREPASGLHYETTFEPVQLGKPTAPQTSSGLARAMLVAGILAGLGAWGLGIAIGVRPDWFGVTGLERILAPIAAGIGGIALGGIGAAGYYVVGLWGDTTGLDDQ
jgi:hypothetical protein